MNANYADICRVGDLEQIFYKFCLINCSEIFITLLWKINILNLAKNSKKYFSKQKLQKITLL